MEKRGDSLPFGSTGTWGKIDKGQLAVGGKLQGENAQPLELRYVNQTALLICPNCFMM
jgi:hypothetical protein